MSPSPETVGIIGGGASGALAAIHLLRESPVPVRVVVVEPRAALGRGVAYGTADVGHLLNVRAGCMSAFPDEPDHFVQWAHRLSDTDARAFLPRAWYGEYLRSMLGPVDHVRARVADVVRDGSRVAMVLDGGSVVPCDRMVLAPGPPPPRWPVPLGGPGGRWIEDPWAPGALAELGPEEPVLLVGTGLTAVDIALGLGAAGHQRIVATSRHGLLPAAHPDEPFPTLPVPRRPGPRPARCSTGPTRRPLKGGTGDRWSTRCGRTPMRSGARCRRRSAGDCCATCNAGGRYCAIGWRRRSPHASPPCARAANSPWSRAASAPPGSPVVVSMSCWPTAPSGSARWSTAAVHRPISAGAVIR